MNKTILSSIVNVSVLIYVTEPLTVRFPSTVKSPATVTLSGKPICTAPADADTVTSLAVPDTLVTPVLEIVREDPSPPLPETLIPVPAVAPAT